MLFLNGFEILSTDRDGFRAKTKNLPGELRNHGAYGLSASLVQESLAHIESATQNWALFIGICQAEPDGGISLKPMSFRPLASCSKRSISNPKTWP
jgi:hypothetical protein